MTDNGTAGDWQMGDGVYTVASDEQEEVYSELSPRAADAGHEDVAGDRSE